MSILRIMIIPNPFTRPINAWVTVLVVALHGATVWAMMSMEIPDPPNTMTKPKTIQIELITSKSLSTDTPRTDSQSKPVSQNPPIPQRLSIEPLEEVRTSTQLIAATTSKADEPLTIKIKKDPVSLKTDATLAKKHPNLESTVEKPLENPSSASPLTIVESRITTNASNKADDTEQDLSAMIRAVTAQFNRDQARQQRALGIQTNRKLAEQEQWRIQAANEAIADMLELAAAQAEKQVADQVDTDENADKSNKTNKSDETAPFLADYGSWLDKHEPITGLPLLMWRSIATGLGDVFIVMLELHVNEEGYITEVQLLEPSGSPIIDAMATTQVRAGQLNPLQQNGKAVDAIVPMSLVYERPSSNR